MPELVMGKIVLPPGSQTPAFQPLRSDPRIKRLIEAARRYRKENTDEALTLLLRAAKEID